MENLNLSPSNGETEMGKHSNNIRNNEICVKWKDLK